MSNFNLNLTICMFWNKSVRKKYFNSKREKTNIITEFCIFSLVKMHIRISSSNKFQLKVAILMFSLKFAHEIVIFELVIDTIARLNWRFSFFGSKRAFLPQNKNSEHHHWILHTWIGSGNKFQVKLTILFFLIKFAQKRYFIVSCDFLMFYHNFLLPQVKRCAIITEKHGIYKLPRELPNDLQLRP